MPGVIDGSPGNVMAEPFLLGGGHKAEQAGLHPREPGGQHQHQGHPPPRHGPRAEHPDAWFPREQQVTGCSPDAWVSRERRGACF